MPTKTLITVGLIVLALTGASCDVLPTLVEASAPRMEVSETMTLFDFSDARQINRWFRVNDGVMGGVSTSRMALTDQGTAIFSGVISFENNGGFATTQTNFTPALDISGTTGIEIQVRGDGKKYGMYLRNADVSLSYEATFLTQVGEWQTIRLPFKDFRPTVFGRPARAPAFNAERLRAMSFIIEYKQEGPFALEIKSISTYRTE